MKKRLLLLGIIAASAGIWKYRPKKMNAPNDWDDISKRGDSGCVPRV